MWTKRALGWSALAVTALFFVGMLTVVSTLVKQRYGQSPSILQSEGGITRLEPARPVANFTLRASTDELVSLADDQGKTVVLAFGYTHCPDVCPLIVDGTSLAFTLD
jgi:cytochrome oxidase Cu insertion factor (SCO1/SenC/PrrC family)